MAENFYTLVTKVGLAKITNAQLTAEKLNLSTIVVGDGNGAYYSPTSDATALKKEVWRGAAGSISIDENNPNWIVVETVVPATVGGFTVREVGLLDTAGDLIAIGKYPETYKPVLADGSSKDLYIRMIIEVSNTSAVTLKVDPAIVIASRKYVDDKIEAIPKPTWANVSGKPASFTPSAHTHEIADVNGLQAGLDAKETPEGAKQKVDALSGVGNTKTVKQVDDALTTHWAESMPHQFSDGVKKYKYGFKTNVSKDGLVFLYEEVL